MHWKLKYSTIARGNVRNYLDVAINEDAMKTSEIKKPRKRET